MTNKSDILAGVPFFALLDDQERAVLAERVDAVTFPAGHAVFNYGDPGDAMYILRSGEVEIFFKNDTGERIVLQRARQGDFFGEISLLDAGPRTASAVVVEDIEALMVDRGDLDEFLRLRPAAAMDVRVVVSRTWGFRSVSSCRGTRPYAASSSEVFSASSSRSTVCATSLASFRGTAVVLSSRPRRRVDAPLSAAASRSFRS